MTKWEWSSSGTQMNISLFREWLIWFKCHVHMNSFRRSTLLPVAVLAVIVCLFFINTTSDKQIPSKSKKHKYDQVKAEKQVAAPAADYIDARIQKPSEMEPVLARPQNGEITGMKQCFSFYFVRSLAGWTGWPLGFDSRGSADRSRKNWTATTTWSVHDWPYGNVKLVIFKSWLFELFDLDQFVETKLQVSEKVSLHRRPGEHRHKKCIELANNGYR